MENFNCTSLVCNGNHYPIKISLNNVHRYSTYNFQKLIYCYAKERLFICNFCKNCTDCAALESAFSFADSCQKRNRETDVISEVFVKFNPLKYENCRLKCKIAETKIIPFVNISNDRHIKEKLGLVSSFYFFSWKIFKMSSDEPPEVSFIFQYEVFSLLTFEDLKKKNYFNY